MNAKLINAATAIGQLDRWFADNSHEGWERDEFEGAYGSTQVTWDISLSSERTAETNGILVILEAGDEQVKVIERCYREAEAARVVFGNVTTQARATRVIRYIEDLVA